APVGALAAGADPPLLRGQGIRGDCRRAPGPAWHGEDADSSRQGGIARDSRDGPEGPPLRARESMMVDELDDYLERARIEASAATAPDGFTDRVMRGVR